MATTETAMPGEPTGKYTEPEYIGELRAVFSELRDHYERSEEARASGGDHEAQLALVWSRREMEVLANRFESAVYDAQSDSATAWQELSDEEADHEETVAELREEIAALGAAKPLRRDAWLAYKGYRRECEARRGFGERHISGEDWRLTEAREAMFAAFDALEKG